VLSPQETANFDLFVNGGGIATANGQWNGGAWRLDRSRDPGWVKDRAFTIMWPRQFPASHGLDEAIARLFGQQLRGSEI
jgi:hypothetical protein